MSYELLTSIYYNTHREISITASLQVMEILRHDEPGYLTVRAHLAAWESSAPRCGVHCPGWHIELVIFDCDGALTVVSHRFGIAYPRWTIT